MVSKFRKNGAQDLLRVVNIWSGSLATRVSSTLSFSQATLKFQSPNMHAFALTVAIDITVLKAYFGFYLKCEANLSFD